MQVLVLAAQGSCFVLILHFLPVGVLLHVLNDALGSVVVVVASVLFYVWPLPAGTPCNWQCYVDPSLTLVMVAIIMSSAVPLVKETTRILLQMSPPDLDISMICEYKRLVLHDVLSSQNCPG